MDVHTVWRIFVTVAIFAASVAAIVCYNRGQTDKAIFWAIVAISGRSSE